MSASAQTNVLTNHSLAAYSPLIVQIVGSVMIAAKLPCPTESLLGLGCCRLYQALAECDQVEPSLI